MDHVEPQLQYDVTLNYIQVKKPPIGGFLLSTDTKKTAYLTQIKITIT